VTLRIFQRGDKPGPRRGAYTFLRVPDEPGNFPGGICPHGPPLSSSRAGKSSFIASVFGHLRSVVAGRIDLKLRVGRVSSPSVQLPGGSLGSNSRRRTTMLRNIMITGTAICLSMGSSLARADHDTELRYVVGAAILGAAIGELAYATDHRGHVVVDYGYGPGSGYVGRYGYRPGVAYPSPRFFARGGYSRHWGRYSRHAHSYRSERRDRRHRR
jgi:hypothetical protein